MGEDLTPMSDDRLKLLDGCIKKSVSSYAAISVS